MPRARTITVSLTAAQMNALRAAVVLHAAHDADTDPDDHQRRGEAVARDNGWAAISAAWRAPRRNGRA